MWHGGFHSLRVDIILTVDGSATGARLNKSNIHHPISLGGGGGCGDCLETCRNTNCDGVLLQGPGLLKFDFSN